MRTDWPKHLYERRGYFSWRHPDTGQEYGLGRDEVEAIAAAKEANQHIQRSILDRIAKPTRTLGKFLPVYREHLLMVPMAKRTRYAKKSALKAIEASLGGLAISARYEDAPTMTEACATFLDGYIAAGKRRMAKAVRSTLKDVFSRMIAKGWLAVNPVRDVTLPAPEVKRQRLTLDDFHAIYAVASQVNPWLPRAMELGIVTLQRIEEVSAMTFKAAVNERLNVIQRKTKARLRIPLTMRLNALGWSLGEVINRCRDLTLSPCLVHHIAHQGRAKPGMKVHPQTISKAFTDARKLAGIEVEKGKTPPTFHELRSLGIRLYEQEGYDPQNLAGHKDAATTALYKDDRGREWIEVSVKA